MRRWTLEEALEPARLDRLRRLLADGGVLAVPTESSYGLAVDPRNRRGVEAVYRLKAREAGKPLPVVVAHTAQLADLGIDPDLPILSRLSACWPGAVTVVLPLRDDAPELAAAAVEGRTVAVRIPAHDGLRALLAELGPLTATSANLSGEAPVLDPAEVADLLGRGSAEIEAEIEAGEIETLVIDGGVLPGGSPSTVVRPETDAAGRLRRVLVLRPGRVTAEGLSERLESPVERAG